MKKPMTACFFIVVLLISFSLVRPQLALCDSPSDGLSTPAKEKAPKKAKKKHKKSKSSKVKVSKNSAGPQDEISDQTEVSQQADSAGNKNKK
jgi:hypothetical protein